MQTLSYRELAKIPGLTALMVAATLGRLATRIFFLTLLLFVLVTYRSPVLVGWITFAAVAPGLIISPLAGVLLDRFGPNNAIRIDFLVSAVLAIAIASAGWTGWVTQPILFVLATLFSLAGPLGAAGTRTLLPRIVPAELLDRANALDTSNYAMIDVAGPAIAGILIAYCGTENTMLIVAVAYILAAFMLLLVPRLPGLMSGQTSMLHQALEGILIVARHRTLRGLAICFSIYQFAWGILYVVIPVFVMNHVKATAVGATVGYLYGAVGIGVAIGAMFAGHLRINGRERNVIALGMVLTGFAVWPIAAEFGFTGLAIGLVLAGILAGPIEVALLTLRQRRTNPHQLGRVRSISMSLNVAGFPIGSALAGMVIATSLRASLILAAAACVTAALATLTIPSQNEGADGEHEKGQP